MNLGNRLTRFLAEVNDPDEKMRGRSARMVGMISCDVCGAAIILDPDDPTNQIERHNEWHETVDGQIKAAGRYKPPPRYR